MSIKRNRKEEALKQWINALSSTSVGQQYFKPGERDSPNDVHAFETCRLMDLELMLRLAITAYHKGCSDTRAIRRGVK